jgi:flagellin-like protein
MKKGISPLIGWVLLIGFVVTAGMLVTQWAIQQFSDIELPEDEDTYCDSVELDVSNYCIDSTSYLLQIDYENKGSFTIDRLTIGRRTSQFAEKWCTELNLAIPPDQQIYTIPVTVGSKNINYNSIGETDCANLQQDTPIDDTNNKLYEVEIIPWLILEEEAFPCNKKSIILNNEILLNTQC